MAKKRWTIAEHVRGQGTRVRSFQTREARDEALLGGYVLGGSHRGVVSAKISDPDGYEKRSGPVSVTPDDREPAA